MKKYEEIKEKRIKKSLMDIKEACGTPDIDIPLIEASLRAMWSNGAYYSIKEFSDRNKK